MKTTSRIGMSLEEQDAIFNRKNPENVKAVTRAKENFSHVEKYKKINIGVNPIRRKTIERKLKTN